MDNRKEISEKIQQLINKLNTIFGKEYDITSFNGCFDPSSTAPSAPPSTNPNMENICLDKSKQNNIIIIKEKPSIIYPFTSFYSQPLIKETIIIKDGCKNHNKQNEDEKKDSNDKTNQILGGIIIAGTLVSATWEFSKDGFVNLWRTGIKNDIDKVEKLSMKINSYKDFEDGIDTCREWLDHYETRTRKNFNTKIGMTGSAAFIGYGVISSNPLFLLFGLTGLLTSGCYGIWNYNDVNKNLHKKEESKKFQDSLSKLYQISGFLNRNQNDMPKYNQDNYTDFVENNN